MAKIKLDINKRYIKSFINNLLDITVVEILDIDKISNDYFLRGKDKDIFTNDRIINSEIYILQYPQSNELKKSKGKITEISGYEFIHLAGSEKSSSESPIFYKKKIMEILFILLLM